MFLKNRALLRVAAAVAAVLGVAVFAAPAGATSIPQTVTGTAASQLTLTAGVPGVFTSFQAGSTGTAIGALTATDTSNTWTLTVQDQANDGHMQAGATLCTGSEAELANPLQVTLSGLPTGSTSSGQVTIPGKSPATAATVASATNALLAANAFTTTYSQQIGSGETLLAGCVYTLNATYTLQ